MMSFALISSSGDAAGYYRKDNYYTRDQQTEASGWQGKGAEALGLKGPVDEKTFAQVLDGNLPNGAQIKPSAGVHRPGFDVTLSVPKSVSLVALVGGDKRIELAVREANAATVAWIEKNFIESRVSDKAEGRQVPEKTGNAIVASFFHDVNRNNEPQLHIHNVFANASLASDGKWHAISNEFAYLNQHLIGSVHSAYLREQIEALGYSTEPSKRAIDGNFEITGVTREAIEANSSRSDEVNEHVAETGFDTPKGREIAAKETRNPKDANLSRDEVIASWHATAKEAGFDAQPLIAASLVRQEARETIWTRAAEGLRTVGAVGMAFAARMGLTPKDGDPLVPERLGRLDPVSFAAAQAVASAVRELSEREAAYDRNKVLEVALQRYGPFTVEHLEARVDHLVDKKLLIAGERMMTSEGAVALEQRVIAAARSGNGGVEPIASGPVVSARLQSAASDIGLRRLNEGQVNAGIDILTSTNRVQLVQGSAGVGKSAALAPVAAIARAEGHKVIALSHVGRMAREFGEKVGEDGMTVDRFLGRYNGVLTGKASADRVAEARAQLGGAVIMIDEASQIGSERFGKLVELGNQMGAARLIFAGDTRQLPAIEAGKPFDRLQHDGQATSHIDQNLRATSPQMIALNAALEQQDFAQAFAILEPDTVVVEPGALAETAAKMWAELDKPERDQTLLLTSSRAMRTAANAAAQAELRAKGEIGERGFATTVLDRVTITREGARQLRGYREGRLVEFSTNLLRQGFEKGERGVVADIKDGKIELQMKDGELRDFDPAKLPRNLSHDAVAIFEQKQIALHEGDRIRWTTSDNARDFRNGDIGHIHDVSAQGFTFEARDGQLHRIDADDKMHDRHDLAYAINVHVAQGISEKLGIALMHARERLLNNAQAFLAAITRFAEKVTVVVDDPAKVARDVASNPGGKTSAIEETQNIGQTKGTEPGGPGQSQSAAEPNKTDFSHGQDQPEAEPTIAPQIEPSRDFDMGM